MPELDLTTSVLLVQCRGIAGALPIAYPLRAARVLSLTSLEKAAARAESLSIAIARVRYRDGSVDSL